LVKHWADYYKATVLMELTIDQALQKAVEAHKAGQIQEADRLYTAILKAQPKHPDANHIEAYNKALAIKPDYAEAYNNMGNAQRPR
jgi:tetratricopeptide (TPR) repeat protein